MGGRLVGVREHHGPRTAQDEGREATRGPRGPVPRGTLPEDRGAPRGAPRAPPPRLRRGESVGQREEVAGPRRKSRVKGQVSERPEGTAKEGRGKKHFRWKRRGVLLEKDAPW